MGDGLAERGLAHAGRADEGEDGAAAAPADDTHAAVGAPLAHGEVLGDAVLHVVESRVLGVEHGAGAPDVVPVLGPLVPGQFEDGVEPRADPAALRGLVAAPLQLVHFLEGGLTHLLREVRGLDPGPVVVGLVAVAAAVEFAQLLAYGFELAAQQRNSLLLLVDAFLDVLGDGLGDVLLGEVVAQLLGGEPEPLDGVDGLQQGDLLLRGQERRVPGVVREGADPVDLLDAVHDLPRAALAEPAGGQGLVLGDEFGDGSGQGVRYGLVEGRPSTHSAAPGPVVPAPIRTRRRPRISAPASPPESRPTCSTVPSTPIPA